MLKQYFSKQTKRTQQLTAIIVVLLVASIGTYLLLGSHAATPYVSTTASSGTLANGATKQACAGSSDGNCVVFGGQQASVPKHIETWSLDDGCSGGRGASAALVQQWLTYADANCGSSGDGKIFSDCVSGTTVYCKTIQYLDTGVIYYTAGSSSGQWPQYNAASVGAPNDDWFIHAASASGSNLNASTRLVNPNFSGGYWDNIANPAVQSFYQNYVRTNFPNEYGLRMDDVGMGVDAEWYAAAGSPKTSHEITTNAQLEAAQQALAAKMTHSDGTPYILIDNGDNANPYLTSNLPLLNNPASVVGLRS